MSARAKYFLAFAATVVFMLLVGTVIALTFWWATFTDDNPSLYFAPFAVIMFIWAFMTFVKALGVRGDKP